MRELNNTDVLRPYVQAREGRVYLIEVIARVHDTELRYQSETYERNRRIKTYFVKDLDDFEQNYLKEASELSKLFGARVYIALCPLDLNRFRTKLCSELLENMLWNAGSDPDFFCPGLIGDSDRPSEIPSRVSESLRYGLEQDCRILTFDLDHSDRDLERVLVEFRQLGAELLKIVPSVHNQTMIVRIPEECKNQEEFCRWWDKTHEASNREKYTRPHDFCPVNLYCAEQRYRLTSKKQIL